MLLLVRAHNARIERHAEELTLDTELLCTIIHEAVVKTEDVVSNDFVGLTFAAPLGIGQQQLAFVSTLDQLTLGVLPAHLGHAKAQLPPRHCRISGPRYDADVRHLIALLRGQIVGQQRCKSELLIRVLGELGQHDSQRPDCAHLGQSPCLAALRRASSASAGCRAPGCFARHTLGVFVFHVIIGRIRIWRASSDIVVLSNPLKVIIRMIEVLGELTADRQLGTRRPEHLLKRSNNPDRILLALEHHL